MPLFLDDHDLSYNSYHPGIKNTSLFEFQGNSTNSTNEQAEQPDEYARLSILRQMVIAEEERIKARLAANRDTSRTNEGNGARQAVVEREPREEEMFQKLLAEESNAEAGPSSRPYQSPNPPSSSPPIRRTKSTTDVNSNQGSQWIRPPPIASTSTYIPHNSLPYAVNRGADFVRNPTNDYSDWSLFPANPYVPPPVSSSHQTTPTSSNNTTPIYHSVASPASFISTSLSSFSHFPPSLPIHQPLESSSQALAQELLKQRPSRDSSRKNSTSSGRTKLDESYIPVSGVEELSVLEGELEETKDDKRKRNTEASARFRAKKKKQDASLAESASDLRARVDKLEAIKMNLVKENEWLKSVLAK